MRRTPRRVPLALLALPLLAGLTGGGTSAAGGAPTGETSAFGVGAPGAGAPAIPGWSALREAGQERPFRVAVARFQHETCTFCPGGETTVEDWTRLRPPLEGEEVLEAGSYVRGFAARAREYDVDLVGLRSPYGVFGGSSRSWNARETYERFAGEIVRDLRANMPVDGVYLALHGAMAVRGVPRPEADLARRVREVVGPDVPIVGTFDLHGNEDGEFLRWADGAFVTKRYPHYDAHLQGERAARFLVLAMRGDYEPATASRKPPVITATVLQWTGQSPAMDIMERARRWEAREPGAFVSVFFGYPWSDVPDVGAAVHVMTDGDRALADRIADDMEDYIWRVRERLAAGEYPMPEEAVERAGAALERGLAPVVLADYSDRPGDATWILRELIRQRVGGVLYAALRDERALEALAARGDTLPGTEVSLEVGGFTGPQAGTPVPIHGTLRWFEPRFGYERVAGIEYALADGGGTRPPASEPGAGDPEAEGAGGGPSRTGEDPASRPSLLLITPAYEQVTSPEQLRFGPVDPEAYDVFVLKSRVHFRRGFDETGYARTILVTDAPGDWVGTTRLDALEYRHAPIGELYPFGEPPEGWRGRDRLTVLGAPAPTHPPATAGHANRSRSVLR